jgi:hypothetical protein
MYAQVCLKGLMQCATTPLLLSDQLLTPAQAAVALAAVVLLALIVRTQQCGHRKAHL